MAQDTTLILKVDTDPYQDPDDLEQEVPLTQLDSEEEAPLTQLCNYEEMLAMKYEDTCGAALRSLINGDGSIWYWSCIQHDVMLTWETMKGQEQQWLKWERQEIWKHDRPPRPSCVKPKNKAMPKFIPNPGDKAHMALRHYKDKHNMLKMRRKKTLQARPGVSAECCQYSLGKRVARFNTGVLGLKMK